MRPLTPVGARRQVLLSLNYPKYQVPSSSRLFTYSLLTGSPDITGKYTPNSTRLTAASPPSITWAQVTFRWASSPTGTTPESFPRSPMPWNAASRQITRNGTAVK